jgi:asparagine synthetase B (glutamine-hydrolysing)
LEGNNIVNSGSNLAIGDFTVFGFTQNPNFLNRLLHDRLGVIPKTIQIGSLGQLFFFTSYGDVAESEETIVLKLGFLRSPTQSPLNAHQLLVQKLVGPRFINVDAFSGNALAIGLSRTEPAFSAFQTLMAVPQLYYSQMEDGIICSDVLRCIINLIPCRELNEAILPQHFLFRSVYGSSTYFRGVKRLIPGYQLKWDDGKIETKRMRSLDAVSDETQYIRKDVRALNLLSESLEDVVGDYTAQIEGSGQSLANLLSGGVDSSLIQYFTNIASPNRPGRSISFAIQVPAFEFEVEYARQASQILHTEHTFVNYSPEDYPSLLTRVIDTLAQPPNLETEPSFLAVAEYIQSNSWPERFFLTGQGGDTLFGGEAARKLKALNYIRKMPLAAPILKGLGRVLLPISAALSHALRIGGEIISSENDPDAYVSPSNSVCVYVLEENWDLIRRCFGDQSLHETLAERRSLVEGYSKSRHYLDKVYFIDLTTDLWELGVQRQQLFLAHRLQQASPFFDEDIIKAALTFHPDMRYIKGFRYKHLLRRLLAQKTNAPVAHKRKGPSTVNDALEAWMRSGPLRPLVEEIQRPSFMEKSDFERVKKRSDYFLWPLLNFDIFRKRIIENQEQFTNLEKEKEG